MKLTEKDIQMFDSLRKSDVGASLAEYIGRLESYVCDIRSWGPNDSAESARQAASALSEMRKHLVTATSSSNATKNPYL